MRSKTSPLGIPLAVVVGLALLGAMPALGADDLQAAKTAAEPIQVMVPDESADTCLDYTPGEGSEAEPALLVGVPDMEPVAPKPKPCKACQDRPWCECRYNGLPRVTCNPCCYLQYNGQQICFD